MVRRKPMRYRTMNTKEIFRNKDEFFIYFDIFVSYEAIVGRKVVYVIGTNGKAFVYENWIILLGNCEVIVVKEVLSS